MDVAKSRCEARKVAALYLGRKLKKGETVHHIDENPFNNKIENLIVFACKEAHMICHTGFAKAKRVRSGSKKGYYKYKFYYCEDRRRWANQLLPEDIVLYGPKVARLRDARLQMFKERMMVDLGLDAIQK